MKDVGRSVVGKLGDAWSSTLHFFSRADNGQKLRSRHEQTAEPSQPHLSPRHPAPNTTEQPESRPRLISRHKREALPYTGRLSNFDPMRFDEMRKVVDIVQLGSINGDNCHLMRPSQLKFPGEVGYGAEVQFEGKGRMALRLAHFLSR